MESLICACFPVFWVCGKVVQPLALAPRCLASGVFSSCPQLETAEPGSRKPPCLGMQLRVGSPPTHRSYRCCAACFLAVLFCTEGLCQLTKPPLGMLGDSKKKINFMLERPIWTLHRTGEHSHYFLCDHCSANCCRIGRWNRWRRLWSRFVVSCSCVSVSDGSLD